MLIPYHYSFFRYCDYHQSNDWAIGFVALSPYNECFIWAELNISPRTNTTLEIVDRIVDVSENYKFLFDVIDPLAQGQKGNTKKKDGTVRTTIEDINGYLADFKRQGMGEGGYFVSGNTKGTRGREQIRQRLKNSRAVKTPFNNLADDYIGNPDVVNIKRELYLPTLWILAPCRQVRLSLKQWREEKGEPMQAYSHHPTGLEMLMKDAKFRPPIIQIEKRKEHRTPRYFQGRRR